MNLQVLQTREALVTSRTVMWFLVGVCADVNQHLIPADKQENSVYKMHSQRE